MELYLPIGENLSGKDNQLLIINFEIVRTILTYIKKFNKVKYMEDYNQKQEKRDKERLLEKSLSNQKITSRIAYTTTIITLFITSIIIFGPIYGVWAERLHGEAELARAESSRKIRILEARAEEEAAKALAEAEVTRAEGVARANKIIGDSLQNNEGYLRYLWIQGLQTNQMQVVYVPTEANLPIMEANRINDKLQTKNN